MQFIADLVVEGIRPAPKVKLQAGRRLAANVLRQ